MTLEDAVREYSNMVYGIAMKYMRNKHDADDVYSETMMRLVKTTDMHDESDDYIKNWLIRVAINCSKTALSKRTRDMMYMDELTVQPAAETSGVSTEERMDLQAAMSHIKKDYREVLELHYMNGLTAAQIADALDKPQKTIETQIRRAREALKKELGEPRSLLM